MRSQTVGMQYNGLAVLAARPRKGQQRAARFRNLTSAQERAADFEASGYGTLIVRRSEREPFYVLVNPEPSY